MNVAIEHKQQIKWDIACFDRKGPDFLCYSSTVLARRIIL